MDKEKNLCDQMNRYCFPEQKRKVYIYAARNGLNKSQAFNELFKDFNYKQICKTALHNYINNVLKDIR